MAKKLDIDTPSRILLIDDDEAICGLVQKYLQHHGHTVDALNDGKEFEDHLSTPYDVLLLDVGLPGINGFDLLDKCVRVRPELSVVMMTAAAGADSIVESMKRGAFDYLTKPLDLQRLSVVVRNATEQTRLKLATSGLRAAIIRDDGGPDLVCASQAMSEVISLVERVAASRVPVLIHGESGAGKEVVSRRIHHRSNRRDGPFVSVNCTALPVNELETQLFGPNGNDGKLAEAQSGTLFLDEVGELDMDLQTRLLRVLQEHDRFRTKGEGDARIIAASSKHLPSEVSRGRFRADLFYRLNVFSIAVPALRDRRDDIPALARYVLARFAARESKPPPQLGEDTIEVLKLYDWPGNVRELQNILERAAIVCGGKVIRVADLPEQLTAQVKEIRKEVTPAAGTEGGTSVRPLQELEREMMVAALKETRGNVSEAARRLGIGRATFYRRAQRYGLTREDGLMS